MGSNRLKKIKFIVIQATILKTDLFNLILVLTSFVVFPPCPMIPACSLPNLVFRFTSNLQYKNHPINIKRIINVCFFVTISKLKNIQFNCS